LSGIVININGRLHLCLQVRALEEQVAAVFDDVTLGDMDPQQENKKDKNSSLRSKLLRKDGS